MRGSSPAAAFGDFDAPSISAGWMFKETWKLDFIFWQASPPLGSICWSAGGCTDCQIEALTELRGGGEEQERKLSSFAPSVGAAVANDS